MWKLKHPVLMTTIPVHYLLRSILAQHFFKSKSQRAILQSQKVFFNKSFERLSSLNSPHFIRHEKDKQSTLCVPLKSFSTSSYDKLRRSSSELRIKPHLITMKLDSPQFHAIFTPELHALIDLFNKYGYEIRVAGGAVRDLLAAKVPSDIDFATTATPEQMKDMFTKESIRMVNTNGESHGTITARINDKVTEGVIYKQFRMTIFVYS